MKQHLEEQHNVRYEEYFKLVGEGKSAYFQDLENARPLMTAMIQNGHIGTLAKQIVVFNISKAIVEVIIAQLLLDDDPEDDEAGLSRNYKGKEKLSTMRPHGQTSSNLNCLLPTF